VSKTGTNRPSAARSGPFPWGLVPQDAWRRQGPHSSSSYSCQRCGKSVQTPASFYRHLGGGGQIRPVWFVPRIGHRRCLASSAPRASGSHPVWAPGSARGRPLVASLGCALPLGERLRALPPTLSRGGGSTPPIAHSGGAPEPSSSSAGSNSGASRRGRAGNSTTGRRSDLTSARRATMR
jgi:hypothetical protein